MTMSIRRHVQIDRSQPQPRRLCQVVSEHGATEFQVADLGGGRWGLPLLATHTPTPLDVDSQRMDGCHILEGPCWVTSEDMLRADAWLTAWQDAGHDDTALWERLEELHADRTAPD